MKNKECEGFEGIPPVGTECEYYCSARGTWRNCEIVAYYFANVVAVDVLDSAAVLLLPGLFRPIKTPEQIAREERSAAIQEMMRVASDFGGFLDILESLYDAGYRKTELDEHDGALHSEYTLDEVIVATELPEWARWVAVDGDGEAYAFSKKPRPNPRYPVWDSVLGSKYDHLVDLAPPLNFKNCIWEIKKMKVGIVTELGDTRTQPVNGE